MGLFDLWEGCRLRGGEHNWVCSGAAMIPVSRHPLARVLTPPLRYPAPVSRGWSRICWTYGLRRQRSIRYGIPLEERWAPRAALGGPPRLGPARLSRVGRWRAPTRGGVDGSGAKAALRRRGGADGSPDRRTFRRVRGDGALLRARSPRRFARRDRRLARPRPDGAKHGPFDGAAPRPGGGLPPRQPAHRHPPASVPPLIPDPPAKRRRAKGPEVARLV